MHDQFHEYQHWKDFTGSYCSWCNRQTEQRYLFPIMLHPGGDKRHQRQLNCVCLECIATKDIPKGVKPTDLPWYDPKGNKLNETRIFVSFAGLSTG